MNFDHHEIANIGRLASYWNSKKQCVRLAMMNEAVCLELEDWTEEPTIAEVVQLIDEWQARSGPLTKDQILFILNTAAAVEDHIEHAERDLAEHGSVGVTY